MNIAFKISKISLYFIVLISRFSKLGKIYFLCVFSMLLKYSAHELYPDLCAFDGISTLRTFYKDYYDIELSNEHLENLLLGLYPDGSKEDQ